MIRAAIVSGPSSSITSSTRRTYVAATSAGSTSKGGRYGSGVWRWTNPARERLVRAPARAPATRRQRVPGHTVIAAVVREHLVLARIAGLPVELARHLDRRLHRLGAAAAPLERRVLGRQERQQLLRQLEAPVAGGHRRSGERESRELLRRRFDDAGVAVPEAHAERSREPVDVPPAVHVADADAVAFGQDQRVLAESLHLGEIDHHPADSVDEVARGDC